MVQCFKRMAISNAGTWSPRTAITEESTAQPSRVQNLCRDESREAPQKKGVGILTDRMPCGPAVPTQQVKGNSVSVVCLDRGETNESNFSAQFYSVVKKLKMCHYANLLLK